MCDIFISSFRSMLQTIVFRWLLCAVFHAKFTTDINQLKEECFLLMIKITNISTVFVLLILLSSIELFESFLFIFNIQLICLFSKHLTIEQVYQINVWQLYPVWHVFFAKLLFTILYLKAIFQRSKVMLQ